VRFYPLTTLRASFLPLLFSINVETLFYVLAVVQILVGLYLVAQGVQWLGYARRRLHTDPGFQAPRAAVLCPCKGMEAGLESNLVSLTEFDHRNYELFFILASESDPAYSIVKRVAANSRSKAHIVIAGKPDGCGEKVNNLRVAIEQLPPEFEILVFADSDGRPGKSWLQRLTAPLSDARVGAATTMRWFIPNNNGLPTALLAAWNAPMVTMLTEKGKNFCWGGGTAIRRSIFDQIDVMEYWKGSVSDDYSMTRALENSGHAILFVPECLTVSFVESGFAGLLEFTNRQILITRVYAEKLWLPAAATHLLYCLTILFGLLVTLSDLFASRPTFHLIALLLLPILLAAIRGGLRVVAATEVLPAYRSQIMAQAWIYILLPSVIPFLFLTNFIHSLLTRKIRWRGAQYELAGAGQTHIIRY
jgi:cellulose synthase/poly-beta-1,6-N-acetylglucosamine synthase-like glycosyltransferase